jgi:hypothetical protein
MPRFRFSLSGAPVLAGALLLATGSTPGYAQPPAKAGVARISDDPGFKPAGNIEQAGLCRHSVSYNSASPTPVVQEGWTRGCLPNAYRGMYGGPCMSRRCACLNGYGPGPAFVQPKVYPYVVYDRHYNQWWPGSWTGQPGVGPAPVFPMVYQPTDTTQLGFYSLHVPYWSSHPGILPPAPAPNWPVGGVYQGMGANCMNCPVGVGGPGLFSRVGSLFRGVGGGINNGGYYDGMNNGMVNGYDPNCPPESMNTTPPGAAPIPQAQPQPAPAQPAPIPDAQAQPAPETAPAPPEAFFPQRQLQ